MIGFNTLLIISLAAVQATGVPCLYDSHCPGESICSIQTERGDGTLNYYANRGLDFPWMRVYNGEFGQCSIIGEDYDTCTEEIVCKRRLRYCEVSTGDCINFPILDSDNALINDGQDQPVCDSEICGLKHIADGVPARNWRCLKSVGGGEYEGVDFEAGETGNCIEIQGAFGYDLTETQYCHANHKEDIKTNVAIEDDGKCKLKVEAGGYCTDYNAPFPDYAVIPEGFLCVNGTICDNTGDDADLYLCKAPVEPTDEDPDCSTTTETFCLNSLCDPTDNKCKFDDGEACADDSVCLGGRECIEGSCVDVVPFGEGCDEEQVCITGAECIDGTCVVPFGEGCDEEKVCITGAECVDGTCVVPFGEGCDEEKVCITGAECVDGTCVVPHGGDCSAEGAVCYEDLECRPNVDSLPDTCKEEIDLGGGCAHSTKTFCRDELVCHVAGEPSAKCKELREKGDSCSDNDFCAVGLFCFDSVCEEASASGATTTFAITSFLLCVLHLLL